MRFPHTPLVLKVPVCVVSAVGTLSAMDALSRPGLSGASEVARAAWQKALSLVSHDPSPMEALQLVVIYFWFLYGLKFMSAGVRLALLDEDEHHLLRMGEISLYKPDGRDGDAGGGGGEGVAEMCAASVSASAAGM